MQVNKKSFIIDSISIKDYSQLLIKFSINTNALHRFLKYLVQFDKFGPFCKMHSIFEDHFNDSQTNLSEFEMDLYS